MRGTLLQLGLIWEPQIPGPDASNEKLMRKGSNSIKVDLRKVFQEFFKNGTVNKRTNDTYICSIPKKVVVRGTTKSQGFPLIPLIVVGGGLRSD